MSVTRGMEQLGLDRRQCLALLTVCGLWAAVSSSWGPPSPQGAGPPGTSASSVSLPVTAHGTQ